MLFQDGGGWLTGGPLRAAAGTGGGCGPAEDVGATAAAAAAGADGPAAALAMRAVQEMSSGLSCAVPNIDGPACVHTYHISSQRSLSLPVNTH